MTKSEVRASFLNSIPSVLLSIIGGAISMIVAFRVLETRVKSLEDDTSALAIKIEANRALAEDGIRQLTTKIDFNHTSAEEGLRKLSDQIATVNANVQYIRGRIEPVGGRGTP